MKSTNGIPTQLKSAIAQRLADLAFIESSEVVDLYGTMPVEAYGLEVHIALLNELNAFDTMSKKHGKGQFTLIAAINHQTDQVIQKALAAFTTAMSADIIYEVQDLANEETGNSFRFDSSQIPFIQYPDEALRSLIRIRQQPTKVQVGLLRYLNAYEIVSKPYDLVLENNFYRARREIEVFKNGETHPKISTIFLNDAESFYWSVESGGSYGRLLPISLDPNFPPSMLKTVAKCLRTVGSGMLPPSGFTLRGIPRERLKATKAWMRYHSCGIALKILSGWIRAITYIPHDRYCDLCYRHAATKKRCAEHATSKHETREGRIGKQVKPFYLAQIQSLKMQNSIQRCLTVQVTKILELEDNVTLNAAVISLRLKPELHGRIKLLATQLQLLRDLLNESMQDIVQSIFLKILSIAVEIYNLPTGDNISSERQRQQQITWANELISLKGFFKCWFMGPKSMDGANEVPRAAFDTRHPVFTKNEFDPASLALHLLYQRAWEEAELAFRNKNLHEGQEINSLIEKGMTLKDVAVKLGYSYSGLRAMYKKWKNGDMRQRNRLRRS